jgi:hypothetical protein
LKEIPPFYTSYYSGRNRLAYGLTGSIERTSWFWIIDTSKPLEKLLNRNRRRNINDASGISVKASDEWDVFWRILESNLSRRHQAKPVHTLDEILLLKSRFPGNIKLFGAYRKDEMLAGTVVYVYRHVFHFQYLSAYPSGINRDAADKLAWELIKKHYPAYRYISLGTAELDGTLNEPLAYWKYSLGAEPAEQFFWQFNVKEADGI